MKLKLNQQGLIPAIAQDASTGQVLMLGYMNPGSLKRTMEGTQVWFYSRSREDLWHKGEISGNYLNLKEAWLDCDADTILLKVDPDGPTCHTGNTSCFFTPMDQLPDEYEVTEPGPGILDELFAVIRDRQQSPNEDSYTARLLQERGRQGLPRKSSRKPAKPPSPPPEGTRRICPRKWPTCSTTPWCCWRPPACPPRRCGRSCAAGASRGSASTLHLRRQVPPPAGTPASRPLGTPSRCLSQPPASSPDAPGTRPGRLSPAP